MAHRFEKTTNNTYDLIIDGFEKGIASSPYSGIANIRNLNTSYYPGVAYVNYKRTPADLIADIIDSYDDTHFSDSLPMYAGGPQQYLGQGFFNNLSDSLGSSKFFLSKTGSPAGTMTSRLYSAYMTSSGQILPQDATPAVQVLVVGAGGGGSTASGGVAVGAGGGGGQVIENLSFAVTSQAYSVTIGTGGPANDTAPGGSSVFSSIISIGGNGAGSNTRTPGATSGNAFVGGTSASANAGAGGGGASAIGNNGSVNTGGAGGAGFTSSVPGTPTVYGGGGGGGGTAVGGAGGTGGGGAGGAGSAGVNGTANTGGGGGGGPGSAVTAGTGGSGVVIISYPVGSINATGGTITTVNGLTVHTFTTSGTWTFSSALLATSNTVNVATLTGTPTLIPFTFTPTALTANTYYFIAVSYTGGDVSNSVDVGYAITNEYPNSNAALSTDGLSWIPESSPTVNNLIYFALFSAALGTLGNPIQAATSPKGINYIQDHKGQIWKQTSVNADSFALLGNGPGRLRMGAGGIAFWNNYLVVFGDGVVEFCGDGSGDSGVISSNWNIINYKAATDTVVFTTDFTDDPNNIFIDNLFQYPVFQVNDPVQFKSTGTLPAPLLPNTTYYITAINLSGLVPFITVSDTLGGSDITLSDDGAGTHTVIDEAPTFLLPIGNNTGAQFSRPLPVIGDTTLGIASYTDPRGQTVTGNWLGASGQYTILMADGQPIQAVFTHGSDTVSLLQPLVYFDSDNAEINLLDPNVTFYRPYVSKVDGNLYFCNGRYVGRILAENNNTVFNPALFSSYVVNYGVTSILQPQDTVVDMTDLKGQLILAGNFDTYAWDYVSATATSPNPVGEQIYSIVNLLNNIYILAGTKGNIYISNGFSAQLLYKMSDFIAGVFDPIWLWGGLMVHRSRFWFQALAQTLSGDPILQGIFSLTVSPAQIEQGANGIVMESQNSTGLLPESDAIQNGILIDNEKWSSGVDKYYSVYSEDIDSGVIDFNDDSLWGDSEPVIETDIIPVGDFLDKGSYGNIEFKLDRPMAVGDSISLYWRPSLTDAYELMGTTDTALLSDYYQSNIAESQWVQFMATMSCAETGSSRIPIREIRLHFS